MPPESGESRPRLTKAQTAGAPPPEHEQLPCPRCDSTNTKFCYYNNYNFSQPRHFCKSCRRYWTQGGTLRDIPIGGGTRKSAKRSRTTNVSSTATSSVHASPTTAVVAHSFPFSSTPLLSPAVQFGVNGGGINEVKGSANGLCGSFTSLLNTQGPTFLALGGLGLGTGFEENGFGLGRGVWALGGLGDGAAGVAGSGGAAAGIGNPWQFEGGEGGFVGGDCFAWPDLAISTPGSGLK